MRRANLQRMADHIRMIPQEKFDMEQYRSGDDMGGMKCNTLGCVIGHCVELDDPEEIPYIDPNKNYIDFNRWGMMFTGLGMGLSSWQWCFSASWRFSDNTPEGAALRIEYLLKNDGNLPQDWFEQMMGRAKLCYK